MDCEKEKTEVKGTVEENILEPTRQILKILYDLPERQDATIIILDTVLSVIYAGGEYQPRITFQKKFKD